MVTLTEIAELAKVSVTTVSRVLNYDDVHTASEETRKRIFKIAEELNYTKHKKNKKEQKKINVALLLWRTEEEELNDIYYMTIRMAIEKKASEKKVNIKKYYDMKDINVNNYDGVIAVGNFPVEQMKKLITTYKNVCFVDNYSTVQGADYVWIDFKQAVGVIINHLLKAGHEQIGFIGTKTRKGVIDLRYKYFEEFLKKNKLFNPDYVFTSSDNLEVSLGESMMKKAIDALGNDLPSAFFAANDSIAIGSMKALEEANISVPDRVSIVGFNDISVSKYVSPPLTTVKVYASELGKNGLNLLLDRIKGVNFDRKIIISTKLIVRGSST